MSRTPKRLDMGSYPPQRCSVSPTAFVPTMGSVKAKASYADKLQDPRWQKKRLEVLNFANWACEECGDRGSTLHVHHSHYLKGVEPWDHPNSLLHALCDKCHENRAAIEEGLKVSLMTLCRFIPARRIKTMAMHTFSEAFSATEGLNNE